MSTMTDKEKADYLVGLMRAGIEQGYFGTSTRHEVLWLVSEPESNVELRASLEINIHHKDGESFKIGPFVSLMNSKFEGFDESIWHKEVLRLAEGAVGNAASCMCGMMTYVKNLP